MADVKPPLNERFHWEEVVTARMNYMNRLERGSRMILGIALTRYLRSLLPASEIAAIIDGLSDEPEVPEDGSN